MKFTTPDFQDKLCKCIEHIEKNSHLEMVVLMKQISSNYEDVRLGYSFGLSALTFTFLVFSPWVYGDFTLFLSPFVMFMAGYSFLFFFPSVFRKIIPSNRRKKAVEIYARAAFQKGKIYRTKSHLGVLVYISMFEKEVFILPDTFAEDRIPPSEWNALNSSLNSAVNAEDETTFFESLNAFAPVCAQWIPLEEDDYNEIPDDLKINL